MQDLGLPFVLRQFRRLRSEAAAIRVYLKVVVDDFSMCIVIKYIPGSGSGERRSDASRV